MHVLIIIAQQLQLTIHVKPRTNVLGLIIHALHLLNVLIIHPLQILHVIYRAVGVLNQQVD